MKILIYLFECNLFKKVYHNEKIYYQCFVVHINVLFVTTSEDNLFSDYQYTHHAMCMKYPIYQMFVRLDQSNPLAVC